jgi:hypothetical protein
LRTGQRLASKGRERYTVLTVNGRITLRRRRYASPTAGSLTPLDTLLDASAARLTVGVRELACRLHQASASFDKAAANLARAAQLFLSGEFLRQVVEAEGKAVGQAQQTGVLAIGWTAADCYVPPAADAAPPSNDTPAAGATTRVYLGCDGVLVPQVTEAEKQARRHKIKQRRRRCGQQRRPLPRAKAGADQRYKEFKIVTYYDETQEHRHVAVTRGDSKAAGELMRRDACRIRLDTADDKVAVVDGAPWISKQIEGQSLPVDVIELDFYHLGENVHKARRLVYGEEAAAGYDWAAAVLHTAKHAGYEALRDRLLAWKGGLRGARQRGAAEALVSYVTDRRTMVAYPEYLAAGRQIGSGPTESMCKATTARLKGSGMRWDGDNAEAVMALDALEQSGEWQRYWDHCRQPAA